MHLYFLFLAIIIIIIYIYYLTRESQNSWKPGVRTVEDHFYTFLNISAGSANTGKDLNGTRTRGFAASTPDEGADTYAIVFSP